MIGFGGIIKKIKDSVGALRDRVGVPYVFGANTIIGHLNTMYYHVHGATFIYPNVGTDPITLTSSAAAYSTDGAKVEIIPANSITEDFDIHWVVISDISANLFGYIKLFTGAPGEEVEIGAPEPVSRTDNFSAEHSQYTQIPQVPKNTRISAQFIDSTTQSRTVKIWLKGHVYGTQL